MPARNSCCGSLISERTSTRRVFGSTVAPIVVILPSNTRPGNAFERDLHLLPDTEGRAVVLGTFASIHIELTSVTVYGAGALPGCTNNPGAALREVIRPSIGLGTTSVGVGAAFGNDLVDLGIGLAEQTHRIAARAQIALGGLLVGGRLVDVALRDGQRFIKLVQAAPDSASSAPGRRLPRSASNSACSRSGLSIVNSVCPFFTSSPIGRNSAMIRP